MPDITMCTNTGCPMRKTCHRATAKPSVYWQSYSYFKPGDDGKCDDFWDNSDRGRRAK